MCKHSKVIVFPGLSEVRSELSFEPHENWFGFSFLSKPSHKSSMLLLSLCKPWNAARGSPMERLQLLTTHTAEYRHEMKIMLLLICLRDWIIYVKHGSGLLAYIQQYNNTAIWVQGQKMVQKITELLLCREKSEPSNYAGYLQSTARCPSIPFLELIHCIAISVEITCPT